METAGIACVPGYRGQDQSDETLTAEGLRVGFPLMVKAAAGGGGRGMRLVTTADDLANALARARSEAASAFGSDDLILERAVADARHIEFQVFADRTAMSFISASATARSSAGTRKSSRRRRRRQSRPSYG